MALQLVWTVYNLLYWFFFRLWYQFSCSAAAANPVSYQWGEMVFKALHQIASS